NAVDATQKVKRLSSIGEFSEELGDLKVKISIDKEAKTITVSDKGIGMSAEEIKKYINQIAFSGATEFVEKYKDKGEEQIIGQFGLGFYSAFMVASKVELITKSHNGDPAAKWTCDGSTEFEIAPAEKENRGTDVILHVAEDSTEFLESARIQGILDKYCKFLPIEVEFEEKVVNNTQPVWTKSPADLKDEDYQNFYKELYPFSPDPLFWIHLNVDYPFNLTGILYFPKVKPGIEVQQNKIQLYSKQVFITDDVKDIVPEFLTLLHGVIDSPDIPLNVSRSFLQSDSNVKKINNHITKKVADKLSELFRKDRKGFEEKWEYISVFVKYGMISEEKFNDKAQKFALLKDTEGKFYTIEEYKELISANQKDKDDNLVILYTNDRDKQHGFIESANKRAYNVLVLDEVLDSHFINMLEQKLEKVSLKRVDSDTTDKLIDKDEKKESVLTKEEEEKIKEVFEKAIDNKNMTVAVESMATDELPVTITLPEFMRRMKDMNALGGGGMMMMGDMPDQYSVAVNANHPLVGKIVKAENQEEKVDLAKQAFDLALLSQNMLKGPELTNFIKRSVEWATK
ncbi:molecular chaperone HtpG, partial [Xanthovirga aplysinae]|uniref:molecular chaperone HtpG n=1 Tax=Xanthovirga aplysinae TaxID=2529853 RepID=UPI0012BCEBE7